MYDDGHGAATADGAEERPPRPDLIFCDKGGTLMMVTLQGDRGARKPYDIMTRPFPDERTEVERQRRRSGRRHRGPTRGAPKGGADAADGTPYGRRPTGRAPQHAHQGEKTRGVTETPVPGRGTLMMVTLQGDRGP